MSEIHENALRELKRYINDPEVIDYTKQEIYKEI